MNRGGNWLLGSAACLLGSVAFGVIAPTSGVFCAIPGVVGIFTTLRALALGGSRLIGGGLLLLHLGCFACALVEMPVPWVGPGK